MLTQIQYAENISDAKTCQGYTALGLHPLKLTHVQLLCLDHLSKFEARSIRTNFYQSPRWVTWVVFVNVGSVSVLPWLLQASVFSPKCCKKSAKRPRTSSTSRLQVPEIETVPQLFGSVVLGTFDESIDNPKYVYVFWLAHVGSNELPPTQGVHAKVCLICCSHAGSFQRPHSKAKATDSILYANMVWKYQAVNSNSFCV